MIIQVSERGVALSEPEDFKRFHVLAPADASDATIDGVLSDAGAGNMRDGHAFVDLGWLRDQGDSSSSWVSGLQDMLDYATAKGWVTENAVQAHVERS